MAEGSSEWRGGWWARVRQPGVAQPRPPAPAGRPRRSSSRTARRWGAVAGAVCLPWETFAHRAQVGRRNYAYTCTRLVAAGELVVIQPGRPAVLGVPEPRQVEQAGAELQAVFLAWR